MKPIFGPNTESVLTFLTHLPELSTEQVDQVSRAWRHAPSKARAKGLAQAHHAATEKERYQILTVASIARQTALDTACRLNRMDWAFWAAAWDAATAIAAGRRIGTHYNTLVAPLATVMPSLIPSWGSPGSPTLVFQKGA